jgi:hypothetical protein
LTVSPGRVIAPPAAVSPSTSADLSGTEASWAVERG